MKFDISMRQIKEATKYLKLDTNGSKVGRKEVDFTNLNPKRIISLLCLFHTYTQSLIFIAAPKIELYLQ